MMSDMQGGGLESLIPKRSNDEGDTPSLPQEDVEFRLPDISGSQNHSQTRELGQPARLEVSPIPAPQEEHGAGKTQSVFQIEVDKISPNPHQPRRYFDDGALKELASSIREFGILQPLVVSKIEEDTASGSSVHYELIAGERRLMAAKMLGLPTVPVIVRRPSQEVEKLQLAVIENIQRSDLSPIESARAIARLQDEFGMTQREIAAKLGKSRESVSNTVRLLSLPSEIQKAIGEGKLSESQGRLLLSLDDPAAQNVIFGEILKDNLSVRQLEKRIRKMKGKEDKEPVASERSTDPETEALQTRLEEFLGTKVEVTRDGKSGKIVINFYSQEELNSVLNKFFRQSGSQPF